MKVYIYEALGNTFILSEKKLKKEIMSDLIEKYNVDGILLFYHQHQKKMEIINKDLTKATMCGNGLRCCLLHYILNHEKGKNKLQIQTKAGKIDCEILSREERMFKFYLHKNTKFSLKQNVLKIDSIYYRIYSVFIGTLSQVLIYYTDIDKEKIIEEIKTVFSKKEIGNINFVKVISNNQIEVETYERGVGFTKSCGTGNAAASYICYLYHLITNKVKVNNKGGSMVIEINDDAISITGTASLVKEVEI